MTLERQASLVRLIAAEEYGQFDEVIARCFAEAAASGSVYEIEALLKFAQSALIDIKGRRSQYAAQLKELGEIRRFWGPPRPVDPRISVIG